MNDTTTLAEPGEEPAPFFSTEPSNGGVVGVALFGLVGGGAAALWVGSTVLLALLVGLAAVVVSASLLQWGRPRRLEFYSGRRQLRVVSGRGPSARVAVLPFDQIQGFEARPQRGSASSWELCLLKRDGTVWRLHTGWESDVTERAKDLARLVPLEPPPGPPRPGFVESRSSVGKVRVIREADGTRIRWRRAGLYWSANLIGLGSVGALLMLGCWAGAWVLWIAGALLGFIVVVSLVTIVPQVMELSLDAEQLQARVKGGVTSVDAISLPAGEVASLGFHVTVDEGRRGPLRAPRKLEPIPVGDEALPTEGGPRTIDLSGLDLAESVFVEQTLQAEMRRLTGRQPA